MPAIRRHPITGDPILFAPERAARSNPFGPEGAELCPFCPGNEAETPPPLVVKGDPWRVRVFPNRYPSVEGHEVIVETACHEDELDTIEHAPEVVETYVERYRAHRPTARYVALFKNSGQRGGASIDHAHAQLMPLPFVPPRAARELEGFRTAAACPLCVAPEPQLLTGENAHFISFAPAGSTFAYEQWVVSKEHVADMASFDDRKRSALASALQQAIRSTKRVAEDFNMLFMNFPEGSGGHFYVDVLPRKAGVAGFELASGTFVDIIDPADAARILR